MSQQQDDLLYTRNLRKLIIDEHLAKDIASTVGDPDKLGTLTQLLNDMDRASLGAMRVQTDAANGSAVAAVLAAMPSLFARGDIKELGVQGPARQSLPVLEDGIVEVNILPGEMSSGGVQEDFDAFKARMNRG